jgi:hypothetical protein
MLLDNPCRELLSRLAELMTDRRVVLGRVGLPEHLLSGG